MKTPIFKVLTYGFNSNKVAYIDIMPTFIERFKKLKPRPDDEEGNSFTNSFVYKPRTMEEMEEFVRSYGMYRFWSKCEYECVISSWPCFYNKEKYKKWIESFDKGIELEKFQDPWFNDVPDFRKGDCKIDVWNQIEANLDLIVELLYNYLIK